MKVRRAKVRIVSKVRRAKVRILRSGRAGCPRAKVRRERRSELALQSEGPQSEGPQSEGPYS